MSDTVLALLITGLLLVGMAAFVPLLVMAERLLKVDARPDASEMVEEREAVAEASAQTEAA